MTARRLRSATLALVLACPALARAQEVKVDRDEWFAYFHGARKVGWGRERIEERPGASPRFVVVDQVWLILEAGRVERETRTETDAAGRVVRRTETSRAPWGATSVEATAEEGPRVRYTVSLRDGQQRQGVLDEEAWSTDVVELLVLRGEQPPGKRTLRILDLPGSGAKDRELEVTRVRGEKPGWTVTREESVTTRTSTGQLVDIRSGTGDVIAFAASEAAASDTAVTRDPGADPDVVACGALRLHRPGPEWSVHRRTEPLMAAIEHPDGVAVMVMSLPLRFPEDAAARLATFARIRESMNATTEKTPTGDGPRIGAPEATTWRGRPAVRAPLEGTLDMHPARGEVLLLGVSGATALVLSAVPSDLPADQVDAHLATGLDGLDLGSGDVTLQRHQLGPLSLEVPQTWTRQPSPTLRSPLGASLLNVVEVPVAARIDLHAAQDRWVETQRKRGLFEELTVERQEVVELDGRDVHVTVILGTLRAHPGGVVVHMRAASCAHYEPGDRIVELVVCVSDADSDLGLVDSILASIRWGEEH